MKEGGKRRGGNWCRQDLVHHGFNKWHINLVVLKLVVHFFSMVSLDMVPESVGRFEGVVVVAKVTYKSCCKCSSINIRRK